jgi:hypothetical protein
VICGIDSGLTGGFALLSSDGLLIEPLPRDGSLLDVLELVRFFLDFRSDIKAVFLESIYAVPKSGAHSMMVFGKNYGILLGIFAALRVPLIEIRSQTWMKALHKGAPSNLNTKQRSLWAFKRLFPDVDVTAPGGRKEHLGMVEAALIAEYGRRALYERPIGDAPGRVWNHRSATA